MNNTPSQDPGSGRDRPNARLGRGLYAITDRGLASEQGLLEQVTEALVGGVRAVQYRDKGQDRPRRHAEAAALLGLCRRYRVPLLINDDIELAAEIGADGVHLGRDDTALLDARKRLGADAIIGVSCYNELGLALRAAKAGADYVAFGRFFPSSSKPLAVQAHPGLLTAARARLRVPLVAIGGITPQNGASLIAAGADLLAVIHGLFGQPDIRAAAAAYNQLFSSQEESPK